jgi:hypothetical protein
LFTKDLPVTVRAAQDGLYRHGDTCGTVFTLYRCGDKLTRMKQVARIGNFDMYRKCAGVFVQAVNRAIQTFKASNQAIGG